MLYVSGIPLHKASVGIFVALAVAAGAATAEPARIVAFGDSLVHGFGLTQGQGLVPQLNAWLQSAGVDAMVENAGVSGDTTAGGAARLDWTLESEPDALIVLFGGNDLLRGIDPAESRGNLDLIVGTAVARGIKVLLVGHEAPPNFGPEYKQDFEAIYPDLAEQHGVVLFPRVFGPLDSLGDRAEVRLNYMQADGLHPNRDGIAVIVGQLGPLVADLVTP